MVWCLFPVDPIPGEDKYYIFGKGTYKVGRKGCDIIVNKDKGVSRVHAEILVDQMTSLDHLQKKVSNVSSKIRIRDCSKYGTYINKNTDSQVKVHESSNKETVLKDGDLVSFGTGNATYKFCFVSLMFLVLSKKPVDQLKAKISSIGASVTRNWSLQCTHVLVEDLFPMNEDLIDAVVARKPFALLNWAELIAGKSICTEIPSCISYAPTLSLEGASIKIADPQSRELCLRGYTFLLESRQKYKYKDRFQSLLELGGAKVLSLEMFCTNSQGVEEEGNYRLVNVIPSDLSSKSERSRKLSSLPTVTEMALISAVLSGHLDPSVISSPSVLVTSSCSTDETVVADSETEEEIATSVRMHATVNLIESAEDDSNMMVDNHLMESDGKDSRKEANILMTKSSEYVSKSETSITKVESSAYERKIEVQTNNAAVNWSEGGHVTILKDRDGPKAEDKSQVTGSGNLDIIYSQDLIVRDINFPAYVCTSSGGAHLNFKRFRKKEDPSGNSFNNLIPFSKFPYKESDYGNEEVAASIKEEKKRKQMEAMAEDLFNNQKGKRRGVAGSLRELIARS